MQARTKHVITGAIAASAIVGAAVAATAASGSGAELPSAAFQAWCTTSKLCTYRVADSSGIGDLRTGRATWVGVDEELPASEARKAGGPLAYYPTMLEGIAVAVNVPGVEGHGIDLTGRALGEIFSGSVTNWNAPHIRVSNRRHHLPRNLAITLCVPARASGESYDFSEFLAKVSPTFRERVGTRSMLPRWRGVRVVRVNHVSEMGECVKRNSGAITFLPLADAMREGLTHDIVGVGKVERITYPSGKGRTTTRTRHVFVHPTPQSIAKAGHHAGQRAKGDLTVDLVGSPAAGAYPITIEAYAVVRKDRKMSASTRRTLQYFLSDSAQAMLPGLGYAPVPASLLAKARAQLKAAR